MSDVATPLMDLFYELRRRNFPLGMREYVTVLDALTAGPGITSRKDLLFTCQLLWAKSLQEQKQVAEALASLLPEELTEDELRALNQESVWLQSALLPAAASPDLTSEPAQSPPVESAETPKPQKDPRSPEVASGDRGSLTFTASPGMQVSEILLPAIKATWQLNPALDFVGSLPITRRQIKSAWRYYRRMCRTGPPVELDVEATIEAIYRSGVFLKPVLIPRRQNQARMLILVDEQGSMVPFRRMTAALVDSAKLSGLARALTLFFHDVPGEQLFRDSCLNECEPIDRVISSFMDAGVLIISDGGAARGNYNQNRLKQTKEFVERVRRFTPHVVWLNPTPRERWTSTTAEAIRKECAMPMFELSRTGLDAAVNIMKRSSR